jgi:hypothetical protein
MKTKDKYKKSLGRAVSVQTSAARPRAAGRKAAADFSTSGLLDLSIANWGNKARMSMKTKDKDKMSPVHQPEG